jgi:tetratricopeptide (TPR) repeat protein
VGQIVVFLIRRMCSDVSPFWVALGLAVLLAAGVAGMIVLYRDQVRRQPWNALVQYLWLVPPILLMAAARTQVFNMTTPPEEPFLDNPIRAFHWDSNLPPIANAVNWVAGRLTAMQVTVRLWGIMIWPWNLSCDYSFNQVPIMGKWSSGLNDAFCLVSGLLVLGIVALAFGLWFRDRNRPAAFFIIFFFATYLPTSNLLVVIGSIMAERFMYLPVIGFIGALVLFLEWLVRTVSQWRRRAPVAADSGADLAYPLRMVLYPTLALIVGLYGIRTYHRNYDWRSDLALWTSAIQVSPNAFRSYQSYGFALFEEYSKPKESRQPEAKDITIDRVLEVAQGGRPIVDKLPDHLNSSRLYLHLGMYNNIKGDELAIITGNEIRGTDASRQAWRRAVEALEKGAIVDRTFNKLVRKKEEARGKKPQDIQDFGLLQLYEHLGNAYLRLGNADRALENYAYMRHLDPGNPDAYVKIGETQIARNQAEEAAIALLQALWLDNNRVTLWPFVEKLLQQINPEPGLPVIAVQDGKAKLIPNRRVVRQVMCRMYMSFCRIFLAQGMVQQAVMFRQIAVREMDFPQSLFDDIFKDFGREPPELPPKSAATLPATVPQAPVRMPAGR